MKAYFCDIEFRNSLWLRGTAFPEGLPAEGHGQRGGHAAGEDEEDDGQL